MLISKFVSKFCLDGLGSCDRHVIVTETGYQFCQFVIFAFSFPSPSKLGFFFHGVAGVFCPANDETLMLIKGPLPTFMHCAREHFLLLEITPSCGRLFQRFGIPSNSSGYPLEKKCHPYDSGYPFERNSHPFERFRLSVGKKLSPFLTARYCSKPLSLEPSTTNLSKNVSLNDLRNCYNSQQIFRTSYVSTFKRFW